MKYILLSHVPTCIQSVSEITDYLLDNEYIGIVNDITNNAIEYDMQR